MDWDRLFIYVGIATSIIAGLVLFLGNLDKLRERMANCMVHLREKKASRMTLYYQALCPVVKNYEDTTQMIGDLSKSVEKLNKKMDAIDMTNSVKFENLEQSVTTILGSGLIQRAEFHSKKGWISDQDHHQLLKDFLVYAKTGNGMVFQQVEKTLKLPVDKGGTKRDIDLSYLVEIERRKK